MYQFTAETLRRNEGSLISTLGTRIIAKEENGLLYSCMMFSECCILFIQMEATYNNNKSHLSAGFIY